MSHQLASLVLAITVVFMVGALCWGQEDADVDPGPHLLINEIEINPPGFDTDHEWVELLNPTDEAIDLMGWKISYSYRGEATLILSETSLVIQPGKRYVFVYPGLRLRNAEAHVFKLMDPDGNVVEETSPFMDEANDDSTWQRFPDGGDPLLPDLWFFQENSRNRTNG